MYKTVVFDFDGTLFDTSEGIVKSVRYALDSFGINEPDEESLNGFIGPLLCDEFESRYGIDGAKATEKFRERYAVKGVYESRVYDGIPELVKALRAGGAHIAVASLKPAKFIRLLLEREGILDCFDAVCGDELDGNKITKVGMAKAALAKMGVTDVSPLTAVMVGDRYGDIMAGRECNMLTVGAKYGFSHGPEFEHSCVEIQVRNVAELSDLLLNGRRPVVLPVRK